MTSLEITHRPAYLGRITHRYSIPPSNLKRGMLVEAVYKKTDDSLGKYILLILDENYLNYVHALSVEHFKPAILDEMARKYGVIPVNKKLNTFRQINIPKLYINKTPQVFYEVIKKQLQSPTIYNKSYRTFKLGRFSSINVLDYKFADDIEKVFNELEW